MVASAGAKDAYCLYTVKHFNFVGIFTVVKQNLPNHETVKYSFEFWSTISNQLIREGAYHFV